jgi:hypothetical protein
MHNTTQQNEDFRNAFDATNARWKAQKTMTNEEIIDLYQRKLNMTLRELSQITGKSIPELKRILMG